jgi:hypothetical protein
MLLRSPRPGLFPQVLVRVKVRMPSRDTSEYVYLNDTDQYAALGTTGHDGYPGLLLPKGQVIEIAAAFQRFNASDTAYDIAIEPNGEATITKALRHHGTAFGSSNRRYAEMTTELRRRHHEELVSDISESAEAKGDLKTDFSVYPGVEQFSVVAKRFAVRDGEFLYSRILGSLAGLLRLRSESRENPLYLDSPRRICIQANVTLPDGFTLALKPHAFMWDATFGSVCVTCRDVSVSGQPGARRQFFVSATAYLDPTVVPASQYRDLFELDRRLAHPERQLILLVQTKGQPVASPLPR